MTELPDPSKLTVSRGGKAATLPGAGSLLDRRGSSRRDGSGPDDVSPDEWEALDGIARTLTASGWYRVVRRFSRRERYASPCANATQRALFVDVETTGLDANGDHIIELALVPFQYDADGIVYDVGEPVSFLEDPGVPIPPEVTHITGIDDEMVRGQRIDDAKVNALVADCALVVAHNAAFDRRMIERRLPRFSEVPWACSLREVPWQQFGAGGAKLDYLLFRICGEFHDGHRAVDDCLAGIHLLAEARCDGRSAMSFLLESANQPTMRVWAVNAPYDSKDVLKARRYRWNDGSDGQAKAWYRDVRLSELASEEAWLCGAAYGGRSNPPLRVKEIDARNRYSARS
jgi:DNA polymerase III subunit epsilon